MSKIKTNHLKCGVPIGVGGASFSSGFDSVAIGALTPHQRAALMISAPGENIHYHPYSSFETGIPSKFSHFYCNDSNHFEA
jgi:hypothetical protein